VYVREPVVDAVMAKLQFLMVNAEQVQYRCVQVVAVGRIANCLVGPLIACSRSRTKPRSGDAGWLLYRADCVIPMWVDGVRFKVEILHVVLRDFLPFR
jgi:hypothetical protein